MEDVSANFEFYKNNLELYYNSGIIIKLINDGLTNIPPSMEQMFLIYEDNSDEIKKVNKQYYDKHILLINKMKKRLFKVSDDRELVGLTKFLMDVYNIFVRDE